MNQFKWIASLACLCFLTGVPGRAAHADDWACWNGPHHEMITRESGWSKDWIKSPPKPLWTCEVGIGFSSVSVVGNRVFTMGRDQANDVVFCLDADSGQPIWKYAYACDQVANMHEGGPGSTPTIDDHRVYTFSREGHAYCLNADDGSVIWQQFLPDLTGIKRPAWGFTASPLIDGDRVVYEAGSLVALDKTDGHLIWKTEKHPPGYGSAIEFQNGGRSLLATLNNDGLYVVDPADGREIASTKWTTSFETSATTPIYHDAKFFLSTGYRRGCGMFAFHDDSLSELYSNKELANHMNNSVWYEGNIYGIHGNSTDGRRCKLVCLDAANGAVRWSKQGLGCGSLIIADGYIVALSDGGVLTCGKASGDDFQPTGKVQALEGRCWTVPVLANGRIYCRNSRGTLVCLELVPESPPAVQ